MNWTQSGWMTAFCWRSNVGSVIMRGCGYSRDPFICKYKHVILYWWDHRRECSQNDTDEECERSPAYRFGVWLRVCSREGFFHPGEDTCCERYTLTHESDTRRPLKVHPSLRRVETSQIAEHQHWRSDTASYPYCPGKRGTPFCYEETIVQKWFSHCHDSIIWKFVLKKVLKSQQTLSCMDNKRNFLEA